MLNILRVIYFFNILIILFTIFIEDKYLKENLFWILVLIFFPIIGFILFLVFGSSIGFKLKYHIRNKKIIKYL